ncbi:MAG: PAS domain S-box protein, partial [Paludibacter sp.]
MKSEFKKMFPGLRLKAEELLKANPPRNTVAQLSEAEALKLLHELDVYQIELDMQNDEFAIAKELYTSTLRLAQEQDIQKIELEMQKAALAEARLELSESALQYAEFYDNAASGFFTLSNEGEILELNLYGAKLLGKQKERLIKARFGFFVSNKTKPIFSQFIERIFESFEKETCEVEIISENRNPVFCQITGISIDNIEKCLLTITDISERKELEMSLAENKERLELAMKAGEMAWWEMEISTGNVTFDSRKTEMLGYLAKDFTHSTQFTALVHPDDLDAAMKSMHRHIIGEADKYEVDYRILTKSGEYVWFNDIGAKSHKLGDGKSQYVRGIVTNISSKKEKEFAIHESEKKYRDLVDYSPDAIAIYSDGKIVFANNECVRLLAANSVEDILGKSVIDFVHPDYRSLVIKRMRDILINNQILPLTEEKFIKFDGTTVDVEVKALPLLLDNKQAIQLIVRDITQRKQAELAQKEAINKLQKIASCVLGVVFQYKLRPDGTSCFPFSSEALTSIYHVSPEDVIDDATPIFEKIHPDDIEGVKKSILLSAKNLTHWQYEHRLKFEDGTIRHLLGDSIPQLEEDGSILWHGYISDITDRKLYEEKLRESNQQFGDMFEKNTAVKLVVDPESGSIIKANLAAGSFYGYTIEQIEKMNINQINMLTTNEIRAEMAIASEGNSTCFNFKHRLASG